MNQEGYKMLKAAIEAMPDDGSNISFQPQPTGEEHTRYVEMTEAPTYKDTDD